MEDSVEGGARSKVRRGIGRKTCGCSAMLYTWYTRSEKEELSEVGEEAAAKAVRSKVGVTPGRRDMRLHTWVSSDRV